MVPGGADVWPSYHDGEKWAAHGLLTHQWKEGDA
jgi:hypothetical protein